MPARIAGRTPSWAPAKDHIVMLKTAAGSPPVGAQHVAPQLGTQQTNDLIFAMLSGAKHPSSLSAKVTQIIVMLSVAKHPGLISAKGHVDQCHAERSEASGLDCR